MFHKLLASSFTLDHFWSSENLSGKVYYFWYYWWNKSFRIKVQTRWLADVTVDIHFVIEIDTLSTESYHCHRSMASRCVILLLSPEWKESKDLLTKFYFVNTASNSLWKLFNSGGTCTYAMKKKITTSFSKRSIAKLQIERSKNEGSEISFKNQYTRSCKQRSPKGKRRRREGTRRKRKKEKRK